MGPAGEVGPAKLGHPVELDVHHAKKAHDKAISLPCVSKKHTAKTLFAVCFLKKARQRFFHKI
jgi:hypothetical protein